MIDFHGVSKSHGSQEILRAVNFRINPGERVGIVGPNGAGKTTVFELIAGGLSPDGGEVCLPSSARVGYVRQQLRPHDESRSLIEYAEAGLPEVAELDTQIVSLEAGLHAGTVPDRVQALRRLGEMQTRFEALGGYALRRRTEAALSGLGFAPDRFHAPFASFSGGWQMRAELVRVLAPDPEILLLDEPSNYLDVPAVEWLRRFLEQFRGTLALISHDRYLLNSLTNVTLEVAAGQVTRYTGNYEQYVTQKERWRDRLVAAQRARAQKIEKAERFIEKFRAKNTRATQVQSKIKMLERMDPVAAPAEHHSRGRIQLAAPPHCGQEVIRLEDVGFSYDGAQWVLRSVNVNVQRGEKVALIGLNGTGKTTLLRIMAGALRPSEGRRVVGHRVLTGYQSQEFADTMDPAFSVFDTVRQAAAGLSDQQVRNLLGGFGFSGDAIEKRAGVLSGGEKVRLAFARLLSSPPSLLLLDEPTTHLDVAARESLESALAEYPGTVCLVSHDIEFVRRVAQTTIAMTPPGVTRYCGGYDYYKEKVALQAPIAAGPTSRADAAQAERRAEKRRRAERIQDFARRRRELTRQMQQAEQTVLSIETERDALLASLNNATAAPAPDYERVNRRLAELQQKLDDASRHWEAFVISLDEMEREYRDEGQNPPPTPA